ncbi:hypothetical protein K438DRAFT_1842819 [Mycena galopus ATCC 62051]|nr:hypothetical protein K438DRAFT_1842819 [Mycena galopus ATCC 62051]
MGIPRTPFAADLRPNVYPYPIATTATGVLSCANSFSSPANGGKHHSRAACFEAGKEGSGKDGKASSNTGKRREERRTAEHRGHRYSRSLAARRCTLPSPSLSASASNANGEYTGGSGNAAAVGSYSAYATSGASLPCYYWFSFPVETDVAPRP